MRKESEAGSASPEPRTDDDGKKWHEEDRKFSTEGDRTEDGPYQGGTAMAPHPVAHQPSSSPLVVELPNSSSGCFSMPAMGSAGDAGPTGLATSSLDASHSSTASREKKVSPSLGSLEGLSLGDCGSEGFPLRSQYTGKRENTAIFPLPTSRDVFATLGPTLDGKMATWLLCSCLSLNSLWACELFCDYLRNEVQRECLMQMLDDVKRFVAFRQW